MIVTFKSKALKEVFLSAKTSKLPQERVSKIIQILAAIHSAVEIGDLRIPAFRLHVLKRPPYIGFYSIDVSGNYRIVFRFEKGKAYDLVTWIPIRS